MAGVVNLRSARKAATRAARRAEADRNALKFGRSKAEKQREAADLEKALRDLDGHLRE